MKQMTVPASPRERVQALVADYRKAPNDADIEIRLGMMEDGASAIIVDIDRKRHALTAVEARKLATILEDAMNTSPEDPEAAAIPNLILALRAGADKADAEVSRHDGKGAA